MRYFSRLDFQSPHIDSGIWTVPNVWGISYRLLYCRRAQNHFLPNFKSQKKNKIKKKSQSPPELCVLISSVQFASLQFRTFFICWMTSNTTIDVWDIICRSNNKNMSCFSVFIFGVIFLEFWYVGPALRRQRRRQTTSEALTLARDELLTMECDKSFTPRHPKFKTK